MWTGKPESLGYVGRADLLRALAELPGADPLRLAEAIGYVIPPDPEPAETISPRESPGRAASDAPIPEARPDIASSGRAFEPTWFLMADTFEPRGESQSSIAEPAVPRADPINLLDGPKPVRPPLARWPDVRPQLRRALGMSRRGRLDVAGLVRRLGEGRWISRLPCRRRERWASRGVVVLDRASRLMPLWEDEDRLLDRLRLAVGAGVEVRVLPFGPRGPLLGSRGAIPGGVEDLFRGDPVLVLGDLGFYVGGVEVEAWRRLGQRLAGEGVPRFALVPCPSDRWEPGVACLWNAAVWDRPGSGGGDREERARVLMRHLAYAGRVDSGLLREVRLHLGPGRADVGTEIDVWFDRGVNGSHPEAFGFDPAVARRLREDPGHLPRQAIRRIMRSHRAGCRPEIWCLELARMLASGGAEAWGISPGEVAWAKGILDSIAGGALGRDAQEPVRDWIRSVRATLPPDVWHHPALGEPLCRILADAEGREPGAGPELDYDLRQVGGTIQFSIASGEVPLSPEYGSWVGRIRAARQEIFIARAGDPGYASCRALGADLRIKLGEVPIDSLRADRGILSLRTDRGMLRLGVRQKPSWARAMARDRFGIWAEVELGTGVRFRLRWIPPGRFVMGSPEDEEGRFADEGPRHEVRLTRGFWLGETPVTQDLWAEVMGRNPSHFQSPDRPVERVSWTETREFFDAVRTRDGRLDFRLPTEAEWEYACRAGTSMATYAGDLEIRRDGSAALLESIAFYRTNSDRGTHRVRSKDPNPWGVYDMLGNVWEWCEDALDGYPSAEPVTDPLVTRGGARVYRGGSWGDHGRYVRAASRYGASPDTRGAGLGFRLAQGQQIQAAAAEPPSDGGPGRAGVARRKYPKRIRRLGPDRGEGVRMDPPGRLPSPVRYAVIEIPVDMIDSDPDQPRRDPGNLEDLAASIRKVGLLEPILVRPIDKGSRYRVVFGERRLAAARLAGLDRVPAFTTDGGEQDILLMQWVEDSMQKDLHPLAEAIGLDRLRRLMQLSIRALADELGLSLPAVGETLRLLQLPKWLQEEAMKTPSVGKSILLEIAMEKNPERQRRMWSAAKRGTTRRRRNSGLDT